MTIFVLVLCFLTLIVTLYLCKIWFQWRNYVQEINKIPGPPVLPVLGNLLNLIGTQEDIWAFFRRCAREYHPIYRVWALHANCVCLLTAEDIGMVLNSPDNIEKGNILYAPLYNWLKKGLLTSSGNKWQRRRKMLTPTFYFNILTEFSEVFFKETAVLIKKLEKECDKEYTNVMSVISEVTLRSITETAMGIRIDDVTNNTENYVQSVNRIGEIITYRVSHPFLYSNLLYVLSMKYIKERNLLKTLHGFSKSVIKKRIEEMNVVTAESNGLEKSYGARKRVAMLDLLIKKMKSGEIDEKGVQEEVDTFTFEGYDTTSVSLCYTLLLLACHPNIQEKIREEINDVLENVNGEITFKDIQNFSYLEMVIKESLRLYPSVPLISRILSEDITSCTGYKIPKGTEVFLHIHDLHHDAKIWPNPNQFDPDRFLPENVKSRPPFAYVPFSAGPRNCIGQKFAMLEMKIVLASILRRYCLTEVATPASLVQISDLVNRTKNDIKVKFTPYTPSTL